MALALRIDSVTSIRNGLVEVAYTFGTSPLPAAASGSAWETSVTQLNNELGDLLPIQAMKLLLFAAWKQANPALNNPSLVVGKTITVTPGNASTPVTIA